MGMLSRLLRNSADNGLAFWCPGCERAHRIQHGAGNGPRWQWNGDAERPTFSPSVHVTGTDMTEKGEADYAAWIAAGCPARNGVAFESAPVVCHTFVTDGRIQYLNDCTHALAGQTIDMQPFPAARGD
jgi:hypothetical protein